MNIDADKFLMKAIQDGISDAMKAMLTGYSSPLSGTIKACIERNDGRLRALIDGAIDGAVADEEFKEEIRQSTRKVLAKTLISRIGGEMEKQVNALKADPTTRARITMAIDAIVKENTP